MHSKKECEIKIRQLERKIEQLEKKIFSLKNNLSCVRKEAKQLRQRVKDLIRSRDKWKEKYQDNKLIVNKLRKQIDSGIKAKRHQFTVDIVLLSVLLRVLCNCSYESVVGVLALLKDLKYLESKRIPSQRVIQNWVAKVGLYRRQELDNEFVNQNRIILIDESIRIGKEKQLLLISTFSEKTKEGCLKFTDMIVHYFNGRLSWKGNDVSKVLKDVLKKTKMNCVAVLSDEDAKLKNAATLQNLAHLPDLCHAIGTCLKKVFNQDSDYQSFMKTLAQYRSQGVNRDLSYLLPPSQRTKARFLNLWKPIKWARLLLERFDKLSKEEADFFSSLQQHKSIMQTLDACLNISKKIMLPLKSKGLTVSSLRDANAIIKKQRTQNPEEKMLLYLSHLEKYLTIYTDFLKKSNLTNIPVSSEIIESLFGVYKNKASSDKLVGETKLNFELDVKCMSQKEIITHCKDALETIFMSDIEKNKEGKYTDSQIVRRRNFFKTAA